MSIYTTTEQDFSVWMGGDPGGAMESANHLCPAQRPAPPAPLSGIDFGDYEPLFPRRTILNPPSPPPPSPSQLGAYHPVSLSLSESVSML
ncbi:hypothetical protein CNYM01_03273 [Colletotrichum nymphaeae SA-01]|uniref:Uncharacterized protein n=1 Tax=Colletotrichum nymphaeae SA-01 TaxID=1460502 RepID=A0A135SXK6_9PEZI|nr:hypothetical protein CNYM01_03273 [Colletotrichum nymphaeae SA-01]